MRNILLTAIGSFSTTAIVNSLKRNFENYNLFGCDIYPKAWHHISKDFKEVYLAPYVSKADEYLKFILNVCTLNNINMIIPLTDIEVDFYNKNRSHFEQRNIIITIGSSELLKIARNKRNLADFILEKNYNSIPTYLFNSLSSATYPLIAKPLDGRSSEGIHYLQSINDLYKNFDYSNYIFQEILEGDICAIDIIRNSQNGKVVLVPRKELIRTKNGAGMTVKLFHSEILSNLVREIADDLDIHGCVNMEFIESQGNYYLIDINPRFSAGIGFSQLSGYDFVKNQIELFKGNDIETEISYPEMICQKVMSETINTII